MNKSPQWQAIIQKEQQQAYFIKLKAEIEQRKSQGITVFPLEDDVFKAFEYVDLTDIKVVVLGQDPYHGTGFNTQGECVPQAHGLAFSVQNNIKTPPSLVNIFKELTTDIDGFVTPDNGGLSAWAEQGVLLLNTVLTVEQAKAHSHAKLGWEQFTDVIIENINQYNPGCVFILWGAHAQKKGRNIDHQKHCVLAGPHPSPLSAYRGFFGCQHFSKANLWLEQHNKLPIDWKLS
ncbi:MAG: uracil-DNA glycosylase [Alteromonadaceae bacterium]|nr:uracil-DNA glycosylase [Alteromonadaceae bacterium]